MKSTMMSSPLLLTGMLQRAAQLFPQVEIVSAQYGGSRHRSNYRNLHQRARQLTAALERAGIAQGDRVATLMWNQQEHLEAYFGVPAIGAVLHTLNLRLHPEEIAYIINHAQDRFLIVDQTLLDVFEQIRPHVRFERVFVVQGGGKLPEGSESYEAFLRRVAESRATLISPRMMRPRCATPREPPASPRAFSTRTVPLHFIRWP